LTTVAFGTSCCFRLRIALYSRSDIGRDAATTRSMNDDALAAEPTILSAVM
jgi:hypothetical protein